MSDFGAISLGDFIGKPRRGAPVFTEKTFYLEEFYGKSLLFALIPPAGQRISDFDSLVLTLRELRRNQTRCVVIVSPSALPKLMRRLGQTRAQGTASGLQSIARGFARARTRRIPPSQKSGSGSALARLSSLR